MTRFRSARAVTTLGALIGLLACAADDDPVADGGRDADAAPTDVAQDVASETGSPTTFPPGCHMDCFGGTACRNGVVTTIIYAPVSCDSFTGSCPVVATYTCKEGCAIEPTDILGNGNPFQNAPAAALAVLCKETPSKTAGAPCDSTPTSCLPNRARDQAGGGLHTDYLSCQGGTCQPTEPPSSAANYYTPCNGASTGNGFVAADNCSYCLTFQDPTSACTRTGCTQFCWSDHQCPQGSYCDPTIEDLEHPGQVGAFCRPGPRKGVPRDLTCMMGARDR
jgi:hypothetical protein